ncbi:ABC-type transport auxiliary lipoprotein family protein [Sulfitobacter aestuariivivens]|uniref:ABC-type transport auxiliary lipoprotein family protein n=1 Tax=Sulfitobacter aestuariivivens TaxID=2766981 RepID=UPI00361DD0C8
MAACLTTGDRLMAEMIRRTFLLGMVSSVSSCGTLSVLSEASEPLDTYDLLPAAGSKRGKRTSRTLLVARPQASAALATDRIVIKPDPAAITYLPDARWSDELPAMLQNLLVRSISETDRVAYVGHVEEGPCQTRLYWCVLIVLRWKPIRTVRSKSASTSFCQ